MQWCLLDEVLLKNRKGAECGASDVGSYFWVKRGGGWVGVVVGAAGRALWIVVKNLRSKI